MEHCQECGKTADHIKPCEKVWCPVGRPERSHDKSRRKGRAAKTVDEAARRAAAVLDDCTHPDCVQDRKERGYSCCAGGYLARKTVNAIYGRPEDA